MVGKELAGAYPKVREQKAIKIKVIKETQNSKTTEPINVTCMEPNKRRSVLINGMNQNGFAGIIKETQNNQTYFIFIYKEA